MFLEITQASYITDFKVLLTFNNGVEMTVDLEKELTGSAFTPLKDKEKFKHKIIKERDEYISLFDNYEGNKQEVFKQIVDIRKFEIELYWKRTYFFWTIIASIIAGYFLALSKADNSSNSLKILFS